MAAIAWPPNTTVNSPEGSSTLLANNDFIIVNVQSLAVLGIQTLTGLTGTISYTASVDGTTYNAIPGTSIAGSLIGAATTSNPGTVILYFDVSGVKFFRLQITAYTSGSLAFSWWGDNVQASTLPQAVSFLAPGTSISSLGKAEDGVAASGDVGVFMLGVRVDGSTASTTSANGDYSQVSTDNIGAVRVVGSMGANGATGHTQFRLAAAATTNATSVKGSPGCIYYIEVTNSSAAIKYLKIYNKATAPTVGTDTPIMVIGVPPTNTLSLEIALTPLPVSNGIALATTTGVADTDATAVTANDLMVTMLYA